MGMSVIVEFNALPYIAKGLGHAMDVGIDKWASETLQSAIVATPQATGALRSSSFRVSPVYNDYDRAVAQMQVLNPKAQPDGTAPQKEAHKTFLGFAANYAAPVEYGHTTKGGGSVAAQPFLNPALEAHKPKLGRRVKEVVEELALKGMAGGRAFHAVNIK